MFGEPRLLVSLRTLAEDSSDRNGFQASITRSRHAGHQYVLHPTSEYDEPCWVWQATSLHNDNLVFGNRSRSSYPTRARYSQSLVRLGYGQRVIVGGSEVGLLSDSRANNSLGVTGCGNR